MDRVGRIKQTHEAINHYIDNDLYDCAIMITWGVKHKESEIMLGINLLLSLVNLIMNIFI